MNRPSRRSCVPIALLSLALGSAAAPIIYVIVGVFMPIGFHDLSSANTSTLLSTFGAGWFMSAAMTFLFGGLAWIPLHSRTKDGFVTYVFIAFLGILALALVGQSPPSPFLTSMAIANAVAVRAIEVNLVSRRKRDT